MIRRILKQDLAWAGVILLLAATFGLMQQWRMVHLSWTGGLPGYLDAERARHIQNEIHGVPTLNLIQANKLFQQGQALFIDARSAEEYAEMHIPRAVNISRERLDKEGVGALGGVEADRTLVVYCGMVSCNAAEKVAEKLQSLGFTRVQVFLGGFQAWDEGGYPAATSK